MPIPSPKTVARLERISQHGRNVLAIFPHATETDPVQLCRKLRRLESQAAAIALRLCNGPEYEGGYDEVDRLCEAVLHRVNVLLGNTTVPIRLNRDPRGCALKIEDNWMREHGARLHQDWGGYGILAPEIE